MQGFILHTQRVKDEDLIVYVLSQRAVIKAYRFYGLRHSSILSGYKIDFELEENPSFLPRLKDTLHLGFKWIMSRDKMFIWQEFIQLFYKHLKDIEALDSFYFDLLDESSRRFEKQNPFRVIVDAYVNLLEFEGRLHKDFYCFACDEVINEDEVALIRGFLPAHKAHALSFSFDKNKLKDFFTHKNCSAFDDEEIKELYMLIKEGF